MWNCPQRGSCAPGRDSEDSVSKNRPPGLLSFRVLNQRFYVNRGVQGMWYPATWRPHTLGPGLRFHGCLEVDLSKILNRVPA